jgi:hypothetical protein
VICAPREKAPVVHEVADDEAFVATDEVDDASYEVDAAVDWDHRPVSDEALLVTTTAYEDPDVNVADLLNDTKEFGVVPRAENFPAEMSVTSAVEGLPETTEWSFTS